MPGRVGLRGVGAIPGRVCADVCAGGDGTVAMEGEDMNYDPWEWNTLSEDEIEGIHWPAPQISTPEEHENELEFMRTMGEAFARVVDKIRLEVLTR